MLRLGRHGLGGAALVLLLAGCATAKGGHSHSGVVDWPFTGFTRYDGDQLSLFRDELFATGRMAIDPARRRLYLPSARSGALTIVSLPEGSVDAVLDFGEGSRFEQLAFRDDGNVLYALASTVDAGNLGRVPLARALLEIDLGMDLSRPALPLRPGGWSRGIAQETGRGWFYSLDTPGPDRSTGAWLSRIDLYSGSMSLRRPIGGIPFRVRGDGLLYDERERRLYALLADDEPESDFDPPSSRKPTGNTVLATIDPDSLGLRGSVILPAGLEYLGIVATPRGVVAAGIDPTNRRGTGLVEIDPTLGRDVAWLDLPEPVSDMAGAAGRAVFPSATGLYIVGLDFLNVIGFVRIPFDHPSDVVMSLDGAIACVTLPDQEFPGRTALAIVDLDQARLIRMIR